MANKKNVWPERLKIRDTGLYDDLTGGRIYTTAGRGYERVEYQRVDSPSKGYTEGVEDAIKIAEEWWRNVGKGNPQDEIRAALLHPTKRAE